MNRDQYISWEKLQTLNLKQTVAICTYSIGKTRVLVGNFMSRDEAWYWCCDHDFNNRSFMVDGELVSIRTRLLRLDKLVREYSQTKPKNVWAIRVR